MNKTIGDFKLNADVNARDNAIFGENYDPEKYKGGCRSFNYLTKKDLKWLIDNNFIRLDEAQNNAPTVEAFYEFLKENNGYFVHGYTVSPDRSDYRVSIEGLHRDTPIETVDEIKAFVMFARWAEELDLDTGYCWWD